MFFGYVLVMREDIRKQLDFFERGINSAAHTFYIPERYARVSDVANADAVHIAVRVSVISQEKFIELSRAVKFADMIKNAVDIKPILPVFIKIR